MLANLNRPLPQAVLTVCIGSINITETVEELLLIASASELEEYLNLILYLPIT